METNGSVFSPSLRLNYRNPELWNRITTLDLTIVKNHIFAELKWESERLERAISQYRQFLYLAYMFEDTVHPDGDVDTVWCTHISYLKRYVTDCEHLFGHGIVYRDPTTIGIPFSNIKSEFFLN